MSVEFRFRDNSDTFIFAKGILSLKILMRQMSRQEDSIDKEDELEHTQETFLPTLYADGKVVG